MALSEVVLKANLALSDSVRLRSTLQNLLDILVEVTRAQSTLDDKLIEYVFFPISHVFRRAQTLSSDAVEKALRCLCVLLQSGWTLSSDPRLSVQLMILLTFLAGGSPPAKTDTIARMHVDDELHTMIYQSMSTLFLSLKRLSSSKRTLLDTENIPALGHAITVILTGIREGESAQVQLAALGALHALRGCVSDRYVIVTFLPGIVSTLTRVLSPTTGVRRHFSVLQEAMIGMRDFVCFTLSDRHVHLDLAAPKKTIDRKNLQMELNQSWHTRTSSQMNLALANIVKLRRHERLEVREGLFKLCVAFLEQCRISLLQSAALLLNTTIEIASNSPDMHMLNELRRLGGSDDALASLTRSELYDQLTLLPHATLSADEDRKRHALTQATTTVRLVVDIDLDVSPLNRILHKVLQDTAINIFCSAMDNRITDQSSFSVGTSLDYANSAALLKLRTSSTVNQKFDQVLRDRHRSNDGTLSGLEDLVKQIAKISISPGLVQEALEVARNSQGDIMLVNFWISLVVARYHNVRDEEFADLVQFDVTDNLWTDLFEDLHAFALTILSRSMEGLYVDWRVQALALEAVAFRAQRLQRGFRPGLVDSLYPVVHALGSMQQDLSKHAIRCLNLIATYCDYSNAEQLLVQNADYLVNAIGLKLSTFDISPEAPRVLLMIVKVCGPSIISYIDDLVDSIFAALECFHGYPSLVGLLFSTLDGIVQEGAKSAQFERSTTEDGRTTQSHRKIGVHTSSLEQLKNSLKGHVVHKAVHHIAPELNPDEATPHKPWQRRRQPAESDAYSIFPGRDEDENEGGDFPAQSTVSNPGPKPSRTYGTLLRIVTLTQHHLPSASPSIRASLLQLILTAMSYLSAYDDSYLPLINLLWPVLIARLDDREAYVVSGVLSVMGAMCEGAGGFLSSRVETLWPKLYNIHESLNVASQATSPVCRSDLTTKTTFGRITPRGRTPMSEIRLSSAEPSDTLITAATVHGLSSISTSSVYIPTTTHIIRSALTSFLLQVLTHVQISEYMFTQIVRDMLCEPLMTQHRNDVREALNMRNPDALWLFCEQEAWEGEGTGHNREEWQRRRPTDVLGAPRFIEFIC